jgi:hypothetical protein
MSTNALTKTTNRNVKLNFTQKGKLKEMGFPGFLAGFFRWEFLNSNAGRNKHFPKNWNYKYRSPASRFLISLAGQPYKIN